MLIENEVLDAELLGDEEEEDTQQDKYLTFLSMRKSTGSRSGMSQIIRMQK